MAQDNEIIARLKVEGVDKFKADINSANESTNELTAGVKKMEAQLAELPKGSNEFKKLSNEIEAVKIATEAGSSAFENNKTKLRQLKQDVSGLAGVLAVLKAEGKQNTQVFKDITAQFEKTKREAGELQDKIGDINQEISALGSDTRGIDNVVRGASLIANSFQLAEGMTALFGSENKQLQETLIKLNGVMAVTQSLQAIGTELTREDSIVKVVAGKATDIYSWAVSGATLKMKLFRLALIGTGIGGIILLIVSLTSSWFGLGDAMEDTTKKTDDQRTAEEKLNDEMSKQNDLLTARIRHMKASGVSNIEVLKEELKLAIEQNKQLEQRNTFNEMTMSSDKYKEWFATNEVALINSRSRVLELKKEIIDTNKPVNKVTQSVKELKSVTEKPIEFIDEKQMSALEFANEMINTLSEEIKARMILLKENGEDIASDSVIKSLSIQLKSAKDQLEEFNQEYENIVSTHRAVAQEIKGGNAIGDLIAYNTGRERVVDKPKLTLFERIFGTKDENTKKQEEVIALMSDAKTVIDKTLDVGQQIGDIASRAMSIRASKEIEILNQKKEKGIINEKEYQKKVAEVKNQAAARQRKVDIAMATAQIPMAILSAFVGTPGGIIAKSIAAALAGAFAIANVALIASAPLPKFKQGGSVMNKLGLMKGAKHEQGGIPIEVEGNEFVVKSDAVNKYGVKMLDSINNMSFNPVLASSGRIGYKDNKMNESLATISNYLRGGNKIDERGNLLLMEISEKLNTQRIYV
ncbi:MAG TPA: hypothetical protein PKX89_11135 [Chitinophagales bacterium]|nr:hypothetical protein [Chitinophagales bacterium]